jgi:hypothetical protein
MCSKPGKGRHGTSHHAKAIYQSVYSMNRLSLFIPAFISYLILYTEMNCFALTIFTNLCIIGDWLDISGGDWLIID